jgi:hypothetical protein
VKRCSKCNKEKEPKEFNFKRGKYQPFCRQCNSEYGKEWHQKNKVARQIKISARNKRVGLENSIAIIDYLKTHPCTDCGESDIVVLDFDHLNEKTANVSALAWQAHSWKRIQEEIDRCEVVCCNCHRRRTARRAGWFRLNF